MRFWFTLLCCLVVGTIVCLDQPQKAAQFFASAEQYGRKVWFEKEVWFSGTELVDRKDLEPLLPLQESVGWWLLYPERIEALLRAHPLVLDASIGRCTGQWWGCFTIRVTERHPKLVVMVGERAWVVGEDGGVLSPVPPHQAEAFRAGVEIAEFQGTEVPLVEGLLSEEESPDAVRARLAHAAQVVEVLSTSVGLKVHKVVVEGGREARVSFRGVPWTATFESKGEQGWEQRLLDQANRLKVLKESLGVSSDHVRQIDLAFEKMAVVTSEPVTPDQSSPSQPLPDPRQKSAAAR